MTFVLNFKQEIYMSIEKQLPIQQATTTMPLVTTQPAPNPQPPPQRNLFCFFANFFRHTPSTQESYSTGQAIRPGQLVEPFATSFQGSTIPLELQLQDVVCTDVNITTFTDFFLTPSETVGTDLAPHIQKMEQGLIVSVGTERSFFDLALADQSRCEGLVVRDINPKVKAYVDFNVLLFRIANSRKDYCLLAKKPDDSKVEAEFVISQKDLKKTPIYLSQ